MNKPEYISKPDWDLVLKKYDLKYVEEQLAKNYPIQYLIGNVDFYDSTILVNEKVLIPRFETELLVEKTIGILTKYNKKIEVLEIGTGSGCISISIAKNIEANVTATDISEEALKVAEGNAKLNNIEINFIKHDILNESINGKYDLIISNPPYIKFGDEVDPQTIYEPQNALFADNNGLIFYEEIIKKSVGHLNDYGLIAFEIGMDQAKYLEDIAKTYYPSSDVIILKDYNNRDRIVFIKTKEN